jgi:hypothetical protein
MKVQKVEGRAEYLRHVLRKTVAAEVLDKPHLTYSDVMNASSQLLELWNLTRKPDVDRALRQPAGQAAAQQSKDAHAFRRFATGEDWSGADHRELVENMKRVKREFPAIVHNEANSHAVANWLLDNRCYPTYGNIRMAVTTLACEGKLLLNPSAVNIPEDRYGDSIEGAYQIGRVSAADLKLMTEPFRSQNEHDEIRAMTADQFYASEHGRALREERNKHADQAIREQELRHAEAAVEFFLASNRDYARTNDNRDQILRWLKDRNLPMTQNSLQQAFDELKHQLALSSDNNAEYNGTRVIDYSDLGPTNPMHTRPSKHHVELVEQKSVKKITMADVRKMSAEQYEAALKDSDLGPQLEALLANQ